MAMNKTSRLNGNRKTVAAIREHLKQSVTLSGVKYAPGRLATMFQEGIAKADATDKAKHAFHAAVASERQNLDELTLVQRDLRDHVRSLFGATSPEFADFGFTKAVRPMDVETKAQAVEKRAATRKARQTMGPRQKAKIKGGNTPATDAPKAPEAPMPDTAPTLPTISTSGSNAITQSNGSPAKPAMVS